MFGKLLSVLYLPLLVTFLMLLDYELFSYVFY